MGTVCGGGGAMVQCDGVHQSYGDITAWWYCYIGDCPDMLFEYGWGGAINVGDCLADVHHVVGHHTNGDPVFDRMHGFHNV